MALYLLPRQRSKRSLPTLSDESLSTITRILTKLMELGQSGQPWQLAVVESLVDRMLARLRKLRVANES